MDVVSSLQKTIRFLQFLDVNRRFRVSLYGYITLQIVFLMNLRNCLVDKWQDINVRIISLKAIAYVMIYVMFSGSFVFHPREFTSMVDTLQMDFPFPYKVSSRRQSLIVSLEKQLRKFSRYWRNMISAYAIALIVVPLTIVLIRVLVFSDNFHQIIKETQATPFPLYYPKFIPSENQSQVDTIIYVIGYTLQSSFVTYSGIYSYIIYVVPVCAMAKAECHLKLLTLSLMEMNEIVPRKQSMTQDEDDIYKNNLKRFLKYFVLNHQDTYRRSEVVGRGLRWIVASFSFIATFYLCLSIYVIVQEQKILLRIPEAMFFSIWAYCIYVFDVYGGRIEIENENLRTALYNCSWIDQPGWFKRSLLLAMTRCNKSIEMKPFGLFAMNLNSFAKTMNAAYSYYNLLHNFKSK